MTHRRSQIQRRGRAFGSPTSAVLSLTASIVLALLCTNLGSCDSSGRSGFVSSPTSSSTDEHSSDPESTTREPAAHEQSTEITREATAPMQDSEIASGAVVRVRPGQHRGMCFANSSRRRGQHGYGSETAAGSMDTLVDLGVDWISLTPFGWQDGLNAPEVTLVGHYAEDGGARLVETMRGAHELGLQVLLKPHLWIGHDSWRGHIDPLFPDGSDAWLAWFDSYERFILFWAEVANRGEADMFTIGVELVSSTLKHPDRWRLLIERVRTVYDGPLVYAANWDEAASVSFWDSLEYIGIQMFAPLAPAGEVEYSALVAGAQQHLETYRALSERFDRPVLLTEVGFKSIAGTAAEPHIWPEDLPEASRIPDEAAQAAAYRAIIETFGQADFVAGMYWWKWFTDPTTTEGEPFGFSPRGKLAELVLREAFQVEEPR